jgi:hypothetical protein
MNKFYVELSLDGYDTKEEEQAACLEFIKDQLNFAASSVKVREVLPGDVILTADEAAKVRYALSTSQPGDESSGDELVAARKILDLAMKGGVDEV